MGFGMHGFNPIFSIIWLLVTLIKILMLVFILALTVSLILYLKKQYEAGGLNFLSTKQNCDQATGEKEGTETQVTKESQSQQ